MGRLANSTNTDSPKQSRKGLSHGVAVTEDGPKEREREMTYLLFRFAQVFGGLALVMLPLAYMGYSARRRRVGFVRWMFDTVTGRG